MSKEDRSIIGGEVMLAERWDPTIDPVGWWMSEKLDGVRGFWTGASGMFSRDANKFSTPDWLNRALPALDQMDGELYAGPKQFDTATSIVRSGYADPNRWKSITYMVFDLPQYAQLPFEERMVRLQALVSRVGHPNVAMVKQVQCRSLKHFEDFHAELRSRNVEGTMLREPGSLYHRRRSRSLLKVTDFVTEEATILGYKPGKLKYKGMLGAYQCALLSTGIHFDTSGMSDKERRNPLPIGTVITVRYRELTKAGVPRFCASLGPRNYE